MKASFILTVALLIGVGISSVNAQSVRDKSAHQRARIHEGVKKGDLTKAEAHRLNRDQHKIHQKARQYKCNDGRLSRRERKELKKDQRMASHRIYHYKNNGRPRS
ncbi:MAG: hypothetical protein P0Y53_04285 [Candidatus Pseudobacter hemicellulosilyticus]|uniref:DUF4148 domain-containing protein n=1 Tax=Candidatus Pseudobacter hemicellulosilyticus TaxID=3121375 RepID=A0AAJ6BHX1_9BACT|nr:MAG: hypothetical protein P0Y53_04285 [Pseudobacter sp.]